MPADQSKATEHIAVMLEELRQQGWATVTLIWHEDTQVVTVMSNVRDQAVIRMLERGLEMKKAQSGDKTLYSVPRN